MFFFWLGGGGKPVNFFLGGKVKGTTGAYKRLGGMCNFHEHFAEVQGALQPKSHEILREVLW